jgi:hypothetical protein
MIKSKNFDISTIWITNSIFVECDEKSKIHLTQTCMKIHHASSFRPIKNKLITDELITDETSMIHYNTNTDENLSCEFHPTY